MEIDQKGQSGLYSVDADTYKYVQVTLINNPSTKNKLTFVSPSGGNEFSTSEMITNNPDPQTLSEDCFAGSRNHSELC